MQLARILEILEVIAPSQLAEKWDQVGLHLGDPQWPIKNILLCIDLNEEVLAEAIQVNANLIVAYHPPIFSPLSRLCTSDWKQRVILTAARHRIALYSPHTALDATYGGVNDWLCSGLGKGSVRAIQPCINPKSQSNHEVGQGRVLKLSRPISPKLLIQRIKHHLANKYLHVTMLGTTAQKFLIQTIAICAGAGGPLVSSVSEADAYFTGEMRHHDVFSATQNRKLVILAGHTQTERPYLPVYRQRILEKLRTENQRIKIQISFRDQAPLIVV